MPAHRAPFRASPRPRARSRFARARLWSATCSG